MKIFTSAQIHELDKYTIEHEPISSLNLMERAAKALTRALEEEWSNRTPVVVFAGPGNNGGDALAVARMLSEDGYDVSVYLFNVQNKLSADCLANKILFSSHFCPDSVLFTRCANSGFRTNIRFPQYLHFSHNILY